MTTEQRQDGPGRLGRYELVAHLATGGMGEIFLARLAGEGGFEKLVVIKRLLDELGDSESFVAMFRDEARIAARLSHPNVCEVYELGQDQGRYYIAMQYLEGVPYARLMRPGADLPAHLRLVAGLLGQACEGLHHAHEARGADGQLLGVVHRDVSPSNLFVTTSGVLKVLDFGIAKARGASQRTTRGTIKGTYQYMSPEQVRGDTLDRRSDVFALGIVLHESLTGERLFDRASDYLIARAIIEEPVPRVRERQPDVPDALDAVVARALARNPIERFNTARELGRALADAVADLGGPLAATEIAERLERGHAGELETQRQRYREATDAAAAAPHTVTVAPPRADAPTRSLGPTPQPRRRASRALTLAGVAGVVVAAITAGALLRSGSSAETAPGDAVSLNPLPRSGGGARGGGEKAAVEDDSIQHDDETPEPGVITDPAPADPHPAPPPQAGEGSKGPPRDSGEKGPPHAGSENRPPRAGSENRPPRAGSDERPRRDRDSVRSPGKTPPREEPSPAEPAPAAEPGFLSIDSSPYATIFIDGKPAGITPMIRHALPPGRHTVRAVLEDGRERTFRVLIEAGKAAPPQQLSW